MADGPGMDQMLRQTDSVQLLAKLYKTLDDITHRLSIIALV